MARRNFCFTIFPTVAGAHWEPADLSFEHIKFLVCQEEICPESGRRHWQGYVELKKPARMPQVKNWLNCQHAHLEARRGTQQQAIEYCEKADTRADPDAEPFRYGELTPQGTRTDISSALQVLNDGGGLADVLEQAPDVFVRYHRGLTAANDLIVERSAQTIRDTLQVTVLTGPPGCGKTRAVYEEEGLDKVYTLTQSSGVVWWNGYTGQEVLLLDDYYGWIQWGELLKLLDIYPLRVQTKGGFTHVKYMKVYITSNRPWDHWYAKSRPFSEQGALMRRIHHVRTYSADGTYLLAPPAESELPPPQHAATFIPA